MKRKEIFQRIGDIFEGMNPSWNDVVVREDAHIRNEIGLESIDYLDLIIQTEIMFDIKIEPEESAKVVFVSDFIDLVESKIED